MSSSNNAYFSAVANGIESKLMECPYNKAHQIYPDRMQVHLFKCRQSYPDEEKVSCPYNATHVVGRCELEYHIQNCTGMTEFVTPFVEYVDEKPLFEPPPVVRPTVSSSENWDKSNMPTYDPSEHLQTNPILRAKNCVQPKERRAFREKERKRIEGFTDSEEKSTYYNKSLAPSEADSKDSHFRRPVTDSIIKSAMPAEPTNFSQNENQDTNNMNTRNDNENSSESGIDLTKRSNAMSLSNEEGGFIPVSHSKRTSKKAKGRGKRWVN